MRQLEVERDLIGRMRARDGSAVSDLASLYGPRIQQLAFRYLKNWEDAEEVAQDVLMKVYRKIEAFRGDAALSSWIYRITFNTAMSRLRTARFNHAGEVAAPESQADGGEAVKPEPFVPGRHFVESPLDELPAVVDRWLEDDEGRRRITDEAYRFVTEEHRHDRSVATILQAAAPTQFREQRVGDALADIIHRTFFGLDDAVNVHPPAGRRPAAGRRR